MKVLYNADMRSPDVIIKTFTERGRQPSTIPATCPQHAGFNS